MGHEIHFDQRRTRYCRRIDELLTRQRQLGILRGMSGLTSPTIRPHGRHRAVSVLTCPIEARIMNVLMLSQIGSFAMPVVVELDTCMGTVTGVISVRGTALHASARRCRPWKVRIDLNARAAIAQWLAVQSMTSVRLCIRCRQCVCSATPRMGPIPTTAVGAKPRSGAGTQQTRVGVRMHKGRPGHGTRRDQACASCRLWRAAR